MSNNYEMTSTSLQSAVLQDVTLRETATTRLIARPEIVGNLNHPDAGVEVTFVHQRRSASGKWEDLPTEKLSTLKSGEGYKLRLDSETTLKLREYLEDFYAISSNGGVRPGRTKLTVARADEIVSIDRDRAEIIKSILRQGYPLEVWEALVREDPNLATRLSYGQIYAARVKVLHEFHSNLLKKLSEEWWQNFFERNKWIFGYGLNYAITRSVKTQAHYGGADVSGKGLQRGDFLQATEATLKFTVLVEIKCPDTALSKQKRYRSGAWPPSDELIGGVTQVQTNCHTWESEGSVSRRNSESLNANRIYTVSPKGILVIGNLAELNDIDQRTAFQLFRRNLGNPEIITFDELYERAKFITEHAPNEGEKETMPARPTELSLAETELPELRQFIRSKRAALAGFMDQGAALRLDGDELLVFPRNDIYVRYLTDNRNAIADLASEFYGRKIIVELVAAR